MADYKTIFLFEDYVKTQLNAQPQSVGSNEIVISGLDDIIVLVSLNAFMYVDDIFWGNVVSVQNGDRLRLEVNHQVINQPVAYEVQVLERVSGFIYEVADSFTWNVEINDPLANDPAKFSTQASSDENTRISEILTSIVASSLSDAISSNRGSTSSPINQIEPDLILEVLQKAGFVDTDTSGEIDLSSVSQIFDSFREIINDTSRNIVEDILSDDALLQQFTSDSEETLLTDVENTSEQLKESFTTRLNELFSEITETTEAPETTEVSETLEGREQTLTETKEVLQSIQQQLGESSDDPDLSQQAFADFLESTEISDNVLQELSEIIDVQDPQPIDELIDIVDQSLQKFQSTSVQDSLSLSTIRSVGLQTIDDLFGRLSSEEAETVEVLTQLVAEFVEQALIKTLVTAEEELLVDALQRLFGEEQESFDLETIKRTEITDVDDVFAKTLIEELEKQSEFQYDLAETTLLDTLVNLNIESFVETFLENVQNLVEDTDKVQLLEQTLISDLENNFESFIIGSSFDDVIAELRNLDFTEDTLEIQDLLNFVSTEENEFVDNILRLFATDDTVLGQSAVDEETTSAVTGEEERTDETESTVTGEDTSEDGTSDVIEYETIIDDESTTTIEGEDTTEESSQSTQLAEDELGEVSPEIEVAEQEIEDTVAPPDSAVDPISDVGVSSDESLEEASDTVAPPDNAVDPISDVGLSSDEAEEEASDISDPADEVLEDAPDVSISPDDAIEVTEDTALSSDLGEVQPDDTGDSADLGEVQPDDTGDSADVGEVDPQDTGDSADVGEVDPQDTGDSADVGEVDPQDTGDSADLGEVDPSDTGDSADVGEVDPQDTGDSADVGTEQPTDTGDSADVVEETPSQVGDSTDDFEEDPSIIGDSTDVVEDDPTNIGDSSDDVEDEVSEITDEADETETDAGNISDGAGESETPLDNADDGQDPDEVNDDFETKGVIRLRDGTMTFYKLRPFRIATTDQFIGPFIDRLGRSRDIRL